MVPNTNEVRETPNGTIGMHHAVRTIATCIAIMAGTTTSLHGQVEHLSAHRQGPVVRADLLFAIGDTLTDRAGYWFDRITGIGVGESHLTIIDGGKNIVSLHSRDGAYIHSFNRRESDPGELTWDDTRIVNSINESVGQGGGRLITFRHRSSHMRASSTDDADGNRTFFVRGMRGGTMLQVTTAGYAWGSPANEPFTTVRLRRLGGDPDGGDPNKEVLGRIPGEAAMWHAVEQKAPRGMTMTPFGRGGDWAAVGDSVVVLADGHEGTIRWIELSSDGTVGRVRVVDMNTPGVPVSSDDIERIENQVREENPSLPHRIGIEAPSHWSGITNLVADADGGIWLRGVRHEARRSAPGVATWEYAHWQGGHLMTVRRSNIPSDIDIMHATSDRIYGRYTAQSGRQVLMVYGIDR